MTYKPEYSLYYVNGQYKILIKSKQGIWQFYCDIEDASTAKQQLLELQHPPKYVERPSRVLDGRGDLLLWGIFAAGALAGAFISLDVLVLSARAMVGVLFAIIGTFLGFMLRDRVAARAENYAEFYHNLELKWWKRQHSFEFSGQSFVEALNQRKQEKEAP